MPTLKFRAVSPTALVGGGKVVVRTVLASAFMMNAQNMINAHFAKCGVFEVWKNQKKGM